MNKRLLFVAALATGIAMSGCKKEEDKLEIEVHSPAKDQSYAGPKVPVEIHIHGGELIIHDIEAKAFEKTNPGNVVLNYDNHVEETDFTVTDTITANVSSATVFTLQVNVGEGDHTASLEHDFTVTP